MYERTQRSGTTLILSYLKMRYTEWRELMATVRCLTEMETNLYVNYWVDQLGEQYPPRVCSLTGFLPRVCSPMVNHNIYRNLPNRQDVYLNLMCGWT